MDDIWTSNLNETITNIKNNDNVYSTGRVIKVNDYNVEVTGLNDVSFYEEINIGDNANNIYSFIINSPLNKSNI